MRGKVSVESVYTSPDGITPAYAGKSNGGLKMAQDFKDHPRLCGEKAKRQIVRILLIGSPPPMRGKAGQCSVDFPCSRITPAYAGKSCFLSLA